MHCHSAFSFSIFLTSCSLSRLSFLAHRLQYLLRVAEPLPNSDRRGSMKLVTVIIKPFKLEDVREALSSIGIQGLTVTEVKGFGRQKGHAELYRGAEYSVNFLPKVKIDVAIADDQLDEVIDIVSKAAYTGKIGDGKIFVAELQRVIRIRTGEADEAAL
ncbi:nitrogen regulatory protein P-II [Escherichia coli D9]|nr:nitrogen regulatory protein P-II [Escherichia coli D9]